MDFIDTDDYIRNVMKTCLIEIKDQFKDNNSSKNASLIHLGNKLIAQVNINKSAKNNTQIFFTNCSSN